MADWTEHRRRLQSGSSSQVQEAAGALLKSTRAQRAELLSLAPEPFGQVLLAASEGLGEDRTPLFAWLAALTDLRPPPVPELVRHFGNPALQEQLVAAAAHPSPGLRLAVFRCLRNLARAEPLRRGLLAAIPSLVRALSHSEISGAAAAALCNLACGQEGKTAAFAADAVPALLRALPSAPSADDADDLAAAVGVLSTGGLPEGCSWPEDIQVAPLVAAFEWGSPVLTSTLLNVLVDLTIALGPSGATRHQLGKDERLAASRLPEYLQSAAPEIRGLALKLCVLLQDVPSFQSNFRLGQGTDALRSVVAAEPTPPTMPMLNVQAKRSPTQWMRGYSNSWQLRCTMPNCGGHNSWTTGGAMAVCTPVTQQPTAPPSRREIAEQLLATFATG